METEESGRESRKFWYAALGELFAHILLNSLVGAAFGAAWLAYLFGGIGFALMLLPVWVMVFYGIKRFKKNKPSGDGNRDE